MPRAQPASKAQTSKSLSLKVHSLPSKKDGTLRLVAISDTHSSPHPNAVGHVAALKPDAILHAGDVGALEALEPFRQIAPLFVVRGNIDARTPELPDAVALTVTSLSVDTGATAPGLTLFVVHRALVGPKLLAEVARLAKAHAAGLVVAGHSHVPFIGVDRGLALFNPGSIGPKRFGLPIVFGLIDLSPSGVELCHVDAETGARWEP